MADPVRVGLVGYGMAGRVFHAPLIQATPTLQLAAIATSRQAEVAALNPAIACVNVETMLADQGIELVVVATPSATHADIAERALRAGKHVVVDKPFALTLTDARRLAALSEEKGRSLTVFHNRRFDSDFLSVAGAIKQGAIGRVTHFESHFDRFRPEVRDRWREDGSEGSGVWFDLGPHLIDQAIVLFGPPLSVSADIAILRDGARADDWAHVILHYERMRAVLHASLLAPGGNAGGSPRFSVHGTKGTLIKRALDPQEQQLIAGLRPMDVRWGIDPDPLQIVDGEGRVEERPAVRGRQQDFYRALSNALTRSAPPPVSLAEALMVQAVLEAAFLSAGEGRLVTLSNCD